MNGNEVNNRVNSRHLFHYEAGEIARMHFLKKYIYFRRCVSSLSFLAVNVICTKLRITSVFFFSRFEIIVK